MIWQKKKKFNNKKITNNKFEIMSKHVIWFKKCYVELNQFNAETYLRCHFEFRM